MISDVPVNQLPYVWPQILPMIEKGLSHGQGDTYDSDTIYRDILEGKSSLWVVHEGEDVQAGVVFTVITHPKAKKVFVEILAGKNMESWVDQLEGLLSDYKDLIGASCIEASCRKGLAKRLSNRGWKTKAIIMELTQ